MAKLDEQETVWIGALPLGPTTEKAVQYMTLDGPKWVPRSQIGAKNHARHRLEVTTWWARKEGLAE